MMTMMMTMALPRNGTRAVMFVFAHLLAGDIEPLRARARAGLTPAEGLLLHRAKAVLELIDQLDVEDEVEDRRVEQVRLAPGEEWLLIAESGQMEPHYIAHVLHYATLAGVGVSGGPFVQMLLGSIEVANDEQRDELALAAPEYVGLWRACTNVAGATGRLQAVLER